MGRDSHATEVSSHFTIGVKIQLSELISQINKDNIKFIKDMLKEGVIDTNNANINEDYDNFKDNINEYNKKKIISELKEERLINQDITEDEDYNEADNLYKLCDEYLVIHEHSILETNTDTVENFGSHVQSIKLDFNTEEVKTTINDKYKNIKSYEIVFVLEQNLY